MGSFTGVDVSVQRRNLGKKSAISRVYTAAAVCMHVHVCVYAHARARVCVCTCTCVCVCVVDLVFEISAIVEKMTCYDGV